MNQPNGWPTPGQNQGQQEQGQQQGQQDKGMNYDDDPFAKIADSDPTDGGIYLDPGVYPVLFCSAVKRINTRQNIDFFIAEFDILESNVPSRIPGTSVSWMANLTQHDAAPGNAKAFLAALMDKAFDEIDKAGVKYACSAVNPCRGRLIRVEGTNIKTKKGNDFTKCKWTTLPQEMQDKSEELRQAAGFPPF